MRLDEVHPVPHTPGVRQVDQSLERLLAVGTARAADDHQPIGLVVGLAQLGQGLDGAVGTLERLDPADEEEEPAVERETESPAGLRAVAGTEEGMVDAEGHDTDPLGIGSVERGDLLCFDAARCQHGIGALDDGRLRLGPPMGHVGLHLFGHRFGFHPIQRVERTDEGQPQLVLDGVAREPGEPVVGMDRGERAVLVTGAEAARPGHPGQHPLGELVDHGRKRFFRQGGQGSGGNMVHPKPRLHLHHGGEIRGPGPGEDVAGRARSGQGGGELPHVDVHAPAVPGSGLGQGRRVEGEDGEPTHGVQSLPVAGVFPVATFSSEQEIRAGSEGLREDAGFRLARFRTRHPPGSSPASGSSWSPSPRAVPGPGPGLGPGPGPAAWTWTDPGLCRAM